MSSKPIGPIQQAWYRWKSLRLPWRKRFLVGLDLQGNTFWEFRDTLSSHKHRMRRIVQYPSSTHYSEIKISPSWHQWLRHTRSDPPSLTEQSQDLVRQQNLKVLAAQADAKWVAKPSFLDAPGRQRAQPKAALEAKDPGGYSDSTESEKQTGLRSTVGDSLGGKVRNTEATGEEAITNEEDQSKMQVPDGLRHHFNKRPGQENSPNAKQKPPKVKEDPWNQARGGPSKEGWQPKGWDGTIKAPKH